MLVINFHMAVASIAVFKVVLVCLEHVRNCARG
jgi:hypothetical protein